MSDERADTGESPSAGQNEIIAAWAQLGPFKLRPQRVQRAWVLGRDPRAELHVDQDAAISRRHLRVEFRDGRFVVEDLGSLNGSRVNDRPLQPGKPVALRDGDVLAAGASRFPFRTRPDPRRP